MKNLMAESVMYITGRKQNLKVSGPRNQVKAYEGALSASRSLYEALENKKSSLKQIEKLVEAKKVASAIYLQETGTEWPL